MLGEPLPLLLAMSLVGGLAALLFRRFVGGTRLFALAIGGPIALFIGLPFLNIPLGSAELLEIPVGSALLVFGGAIALAATWVGFGKDAPR
jgi:hypothetical protein